MESICFAAPIPLLAGPILRLVAIIRDYGCLVLQPWVPALVAVILVKRMGCLNVVHPA